MEGPKNAREMDLFKKRLATKVQGLRSTKAGRAHLVKAFGAKAVSNGQSNGKP